MDRESLKRRLAAILSADVEGYSRLMRDDEEATVCRLTEYRTVITTLVELYRGRVVDSPGDNLLAEFGSVVDAVNCAVEIQHEMVERNVELPESCRMRFRIGVNLGDIIEEGDRIYGDGVNIAARMESLAEADGICISGTVYDSIVVKLGLEYEYMGEQAVKNISELIRSYRVLSYPGAASRRSVETKKAAGKRWRKATLALTVLALVGAGILTVWQFYLRPAPPLNKSASSERVAVPLPDKPSIAVLPFANLNDDPKQDNFCDGMTEDLITDLSKIPDLFVIARNTVSKYKGRSVDVNKVGRELGVRYVLEGSVRMADNRVRINAQLIDATTGGHLWAERYEEPMVDIFALQNKITRNIAEVISVKLTIDVKKAVPERETDNLEAYLTFLKGWQHYRRFNPSEFTKAIPFFEKTIDLDPNYWRAYAVLAKIYLAAYQSHAWRHKMGLTRSDSYKLINVYLTAAMKGPTPLAHEVATQLHIRLADYDGAVVEAKKAIDLDPYDPDSHLAMGYALSYAGRHREAVDFFKQAMRLDPFFKDNFGQQGLGKAYFFMLQFENAVNMFERAYKSNPERIHTLWFLVATYGHLGRIGEAEDTLAKIREYSPRASNFKLIYTSDIFRSKDPADLQLLIDGLRKAGIPE